jgi:hypothetical protein
MKKGLSNYTNEELLTEITQRGFQVSRKFPKPISAQCFKCQKQFWIKWVVPQNDYSKKNNWDYWTERDKHQNQRVCDSCLRSIYLEDKKFYLANVKDIKKKRMLSSYVCITLLELNVSNLFSSKTNLSYK